MITIVGSSVLPVSEEIAASIVGILATVDHNTETVGIRGRYNLAAGWPRQSGVSPIEQMVDDVVRGMGGVIKFFSSEGGSRGNFIRDRNMVRASSHVYAFLAEEVLQQQVSGTRKDDILGGGTGHVITVCIQESIPLESYVVGSNGVPVFLGGWP